jgi:hypothetical protein
MIDNLDGFAPTAVLIGEGSRADRIWTRDEFLTLCDLMRNDNPQDEFLHVYRDASGTARFVKAKRALADRRARWSWDTIIGRAKHQVAIGFYPWNSHGQSRWAAIDFDAHDGGAARAKTFALAAFQILYRYPQFHLILATSGSKGWHLFVFSAEFHSVENWVRLLKRVVDQMGAQIRSGVCEIFPNEMRSGSRPHAIRAPGTWNPKTNQIGAIFFTSIGALLQKERKKEVSTFLYHSSSEADASQLNDSKTLSFYCGGHENWLDQFAITQPSTRHAQLEALVYCIFRQVGHEVARLIADIQYRAARFQPKATLAEHLEEFEELWTWVTSQWRTDLSDAEQETFSKLETETQRDLFRILKNFARQAAITKQPDFPFPIQHVASRLGVAFQHVSKLRQRFVDASIIVQTAPSVTNRSAARFRWVIPDNVAAGPCCLTEGPLE